MTPNMTPKADTVTAGPASPGAPGYTAEPEKGGGYYPVIFKGGAWDGWETDLPGSMLQRSITGPAGAVTCKTPAGYELRRYINPVPRNLPPDWISYTLDVYEKQRRRAGEVFVYRHTGTQEVHRCAAARVRDGKRCGCEAARGGMCGQHANKLAPAVYATEAV